MAEGPLVLYHDSFWVSPYVFSAFVALREKGLPFETRSVSLPDGDQRQPEYVDRSLTGRVPALQHGDFWLAESSAIVEYLEEAFPPPRFARLLPAEAEPRARARQVMAWLRSDLLALRQERPTATMFYQRALAPLGSAGAAAAEKLLRAASLLLPAGATSLFGDWTIADADLAFMLHRLILNGHEVPSGLRAFADAQWARPTVRAFVERERLPYRAY